MMEKRGKYLPVWGRYADLFMELSNQKAGELIKAMIGYFFMDEEPELKGKTAIYWSFLKNDLDYARESYETKVRNGQKGGRPKKVQPEETENNRKKPKETENNREQTENNREQTEANRKKQITITESESITESRSNTETQSDSGSAGGPPAEGICISEKMSFGEFGWVKLTRQEYESLEKQMGPWDLQRCIHYVDESAQLTGNRNRWKDWYLLLQRCHRERWHESYKQEQQIPKGASGVLGEAELEAIRRVMAMD